MTTAADILVENGRVLTMDARSRTIPGGAVAIRGDCIAAVGRAEEFVAWTAAKRIDARGGIIMPGLVNTHTHAAMTCFRGLADDLPLTTWLNDHIFPAEAMLDERKVYCGALLACAEMIMSGTTTFCDMYLFEDAVARAARHAGMRAVVGEVLFDFPSPSYGPLEQGFAATETLIRTFRDDPRITIAVEPHSPYLCAPELLTRAFELAGRHGIPMVIHLAETVSEVATIRSRYGRTPVGHLAALGVLAPNVLACHGVELTDDDIGLLKRHDVKVSHNPESNMKLASGIAPVPRCLRPVSASGWGRMGPPATTTSTCFSKWTRPPSSTKWRPSTPRCSTPKRCCAWQPSRARGPWGLPSGSAPSNRARKPTSSSSTPASRTSPPCTTPPPSWCMPPGAATSLPSSSTAGSSWKMAAC